MLQKWKVAVKPKGMEPSVLTVTANTLSAALHVAPYSWRHHNGTPTISRDGVPYVIPSSHPIEGVALVGIAA
jgi:hypothetical protein